jgi:hypothetical protein
MKAGGIGIGHARLIRTGHPSIYGRVASGWTRYRRQRSVAEHTLPQSLNRWDRPAFGGEVYHFMRSSSSVSDSQTADQQDARLILWRNDYRDIIS